MDTAEGDHILRCPLRRLGRTFGDTAVDRGRQAVPGAIAAVQSRGRGVARRKHRRMATVQVRDLSEDAYETSRKRARAAGQSFQTYLHDLLEAEAAKASKAPKAEVPGAMRETLARDPGPGITRESILADLGSNTPRPAPDG